MTGRPAAAWRTFFRARATCSFTGAADDARTPPRHLVLPPQFTRTQSQAAAPFIGSQRGEKELIRSRHSSGSRNHSEIPQPLTDKTAFAYSQTNKTSLILCMRMQSCQLTGNTDVYCKLTLCLVGNNSCRHFCARASVRQQS